MSCCSSVQGIAGLLGQSTCALQSAMKREFMPWLPHLYLTFAPAFFHPEPFSFRLSLFLFCHSFFVRPFSWRCIFFSFICVLWSIFPCCLFLTACTVYVSSPTLRTCTYLTPTYNLLQLISITVSSLRLSLPLLNLPYNVSYCLFFFFNELLTDWILPVALL